MANKDPEVMELQTISGLALHVHSVENQFSLANIASVSYFAKEKITLNVYYFSILLIRKKACLENPVLTRQNLPVS